MLIRVAALAVLLATPGAAQDAAAALEACLGNGSDPDCIGSAAAQCIPTAGAEAAAVAACYDAETAAWQHRLDAALATLRQDAAAADAIITRTVAAEQLPAGRGLPGQPDASAPPPADADPAVPPAPGAEVAAASPATLPGSEQSPDAVSGALPGQGAVAPLSGEAALTRAQTAWLAWRDAECDWHAMGFDPQAADAAAAECRMIRTAERALSLEPRGQAVDGP